MMEKAAFGAVPLEFMIESHPNWHTVYWMHHPELHAVKFSDGSVIFVQAAASTVNQEMNNSREQAGYLRGAPTPGQLTHEPDVDNYDDMKDEADHRRVTAAMDDAVEETDFSDNGKPDPIADALKSFGLGTNKNKE